MAGLGVEERRSQLAKHNSIAHIFSLFVRQLYRWSSLRAEKGEHGSEAYARVRLKRQKWLSVRLVSPLQEKGD